MTDSDTSAEVRLMHFDMATIFGYLASREAPVTEVELLRRLTGEERLPGDRKRLFALHFSLYHALHTLRYHETGYYLHMDPMRLRLAPLPGCGRCVRYFPEPGRYCGKSAGDGRFCSWHLPEEELGARHLLFDPMAEFYLNPDNISFGLNPLIEKLARGVVVYSFRRGEVDAALRFFNMVHPSRRSLQKRYHDLARLYHPDMVNGSDGMMKQLNSHYQVLLEVFLI